jgi:hypothetical protein
MSIGIGISGSPYITTFMIRETSRLIESLLQVQELPSVVHN